MTRAPWQPRSGLESGCVDPMSVTLEKVLGLINRSDVRISEHGYEELAADGITVQEILSGVSGSQIVEDYPDFPKGPSILLLQFDESGKPIHSVWGIPKGHDRPAVLITAYRPDPKRWDSTFIKRRS